MAFWTLRFEQGRSALRQGLIVARDDANGLVPESGDRFELWSIDAQG